MNCVERVLYYSDTVVPEPFAPPANAIVPSPTWPERGALEFSDYVMRYRPDTQDVLHNVSFAVQGGEKIGIVGRTGSGKSSLMVSLFRLIGENCHSGRIVLDGVDIDRIGLNTLRPELAIIPQVGAPTLYLGMVHRLELLHILLRRTPSCFRVLFGLISTLSASWDPT